MAFKIVLEDDFTPEGIGRMALDLEKARIAVAAAAASGASEERQSKPAESAPAAEERVRDSVAEALEAAEKAAEETRILLHLELVRSLRTTKYWRLLSAAYRLQSKSKGYFSIKELATMAGYREGTAYGYKDDIGFKAQKYGVHRTFYRTVMNCWRMTPALYEAVRREVAAKDSSAAGRRPVAG